MNLHTRLGVFIALVTLLGGTVTAGPSAAHGRREPTFTPTFAPADCPVYTEPGLPPDLVPTLPHRCGFVTVPLDHRDPGRGTIELAVGIMAATEPGPDAATEPLLILGGGPGDKTVAPFTFLTSVPQVPLVGFRRTRDLVVIDQRGAGAARPALDCPEEAAAVDPEASTEEAFRAAVAAAGACHDRLTSAGVDLSAFDTAANLRDLDLVRRALGYDRWHVFGTSYGARLAWQAARRSPRHLASLVLASPVPAEENFLEDAPRSFAAAMDALVAACAADPACAAAYPALAVDAFAAVERLRAAPLRVSVPDPATGESIVVTVDEATLATALFTMFYVSSGPVLMPYVITEVARGNGIPLLQATPRIPPDTVSTGMQHSFVCAEEVPYTRPLALLGSVWFGGPYARALWRGSGRLFYGICEVWPVEPGERVVFAPVHTDVPTLVVTGQFDQITPPAYGRTVARQARRSTYVEVPGIGHSPLFNVGVCGPELVTAFTADPTASLDTACLPDAPVFLPPDEAAAALTPQSPGAAVTAFAPAPQALRG